MRHYSRFKAFALCVGLAALAGCIPQPEKSATAPQGLMPPQIATAAAGCAARATKAWNAGKETFNVEAFTDGPDCAKAIAVLVIRNSKGESVWIDTFNVSQNLALSEAKTAADMQPALATWIDQSNSERTGPATTGDLPAWGPGQDQPIRGEFPFYVEEGMVRADYAKLRAQKLPMFCYVQGIESEACLALYDGSFEKIGAQSFPG